MAKKQSSDGKLSQPQITQRFGVPKTIIRKYFPKSGYRSVRGRAGRIYTVPVWTEAEVRSLLNRSDIVKAMEVSRQQHQLELWQREAEKLFSAYSPDALIERAKKLDRAFVLHVGPTNSGKTYGAIEDLKKHTPGFYLAPLRLLALEMFDKLNDAGVLCSMVTGEESILIPGADTVSGTIELCDYSRRVKTAVIDEAQLIADPERGASWLKAICLVNAEVVHVCMAPEAQNYVERLIRAFDAPYTVQKHQRLAPLKYAGNVKGYRDLQADDAVICFSRKSVLSTAALLERNGFRASVIYGALPPEARRNEVRKYLSGETNIVVATDAIGMGISLPIRRVIFAETEKFDGKTFRSLNTAEINQIGGRAGRYGMHEKGEVLVLGKDTAIGTKLGKQPRSIQAGCIAFPREALHTDIPLPVLLKVWQSMPERREFVREDMREPLSLLRMLKKEQDAEKELLFDLITCPVDSRNEELLRYWARCARAILHHHRIPKPSFETETLAGCELQYKAYDVHHQLLRRLGLPDDCTKQRSEICDRIAELMLQSKAPYIRRCRLCNRELPIGTVWNYCDRCRVEMG